MSPVAFSHGKPFKPSNNNTAASQAVALSQAVRQEFIITVLRRVCLSQAFPVFFARSSQSYPVGVEINPAQPSAEHMSKIGAHKTTKQNIANIIIYIIIIIIIIILIIIIYYYS